MNAAIYVFVATLALLGAYFKGHHDELRDCEARQRAVQAQAQDAYNRMENHFLAVRKDLEQQLEEQAHEKQVVTQYVDKIVERPLYRNVCLDGDGLRLVNQALSGLDPAAPANGHEVLRPAHPAR